MPAGAASVTVYDGHDTIGGTKIQVESGGTRLLVDFGTNYQRMGRFYEEFLQPRSARGIVDYLELGLLPKIRGAYRRDLMPPRDYPEGDEGWPGARPDAVLLSHGHLDHAGGLAFLDPSIPVLASPTTLALLRAWQETGKTGMAQEVTYTASHRPTKTEGTVGDSLKGRLLETDRASPRRGRTFRSFGALPGPLRRVWETSPLGPRTAYDPGDLTMAPERLGGIHVEAHGVDHSVYGSLGFLLEVDGGTVAYSGDLRFHGERAGATEAFVRRLESHRPDLLLVEGTRLEPEGSPASERGVSEATVERNCRTAVEGASGRLVVADFGPRNIERLRSFRRIAQATGRELVVTPKDAYLLHVLNAADPSIELGLGPGAGRILEEPSAGREPPWLGLVRDRFADAHLNPEAVVDAPGRFLLCFSFFDCNDLIDLRKATPGGLWLYSSSEAHGEEQEFDFQRLDAWIRWAGMRAVGFRLVEENGRWRPSFRHPKDVGHHASGHATQTELLDFIGRANPRRIVPVHTAESPTRYAALLRDHGWTGEVVAPAPGTPIAI